MSGSVIDPRFIKRLQPHICREGVFEKDEVVCSDKPPPLDIERYLAVDKYTEITSFKTHPLVRLCQAYDSIDDQMCVDMDSRSKDELKDLIDGVADGKTTKVTESQVWSIVARQPSAVSSDQYRRMMRHYDERAEVLYKGLAELLKLKEDPEKNRAAIERKKIDLYKEALTSVCIDNDTISLDNLKKGCEKALSEHSNMVVQRTGLIAAAVTTGVGILTAIGATLKKIITSRNPLKPFRDLGAKWRDSTKSGFVNNWIKRPIKAAWAFFVAQKDLSADPSSTTTPADTTDATVPAATTAATTDDAAVNEDAPPEPTPPPTNMEAALESQRIANATVALLRVNEVTTQLIGISEGRTRPFDNNVREVLSQLKDLSESGDTNSANLKRIAEFIESREMSSLWKLVSGELEREIMREFAPEAIDLFTSATESMRAGRFKKGKVIPELKAAVVVAQEKWAKKEELSNLYLTMLKAKTVIDETVDKKRGIKGTWRETSSYFFTMFNDMGEVLETLKLAAELFIRRPEMLLSFSDADISNMNGLASAAKWLISHKAAKKKVELKLTGLEMNLSVPKELRRDLFLIYYEGLENAIMHNKEKPPKEVSFTMEASGSTIITSIVNTDRGPRTAAMIAEALRERRDGSGMATICELCERHGVRVQYERRPQGIALILTMDIDEKWRRPAIPPDDQPDGGSSPSAVLAAAAAAEEVEDEQIPVIEEDAFGLPTAGLFAGAPLGAKIGR